MPIYLESMHFAYFGVFLGLFCTFRPIEPKVNTSKGLTSLK